eukprot:gnl/MRDRNA2_/MRDRNA2_198754_c0_seq1.p1 gnl/MRDRNA2_/MRDRNA2_198754_c0~~gnl/MRDRNA2_/MRDRNA2_198754_c0_seq1.p1  ORF type:complete len:231 (-),score=40.02 gnl/MRDRNA2_/MRDRNA2_198754_c0_seq1:262-897(-)
MASLYMAITGGVSWGELQEPLVQHISPLFLPFFSLYIAFSMLALLNVVTGIFVEKAMASALDDRDSIIQEQLNMEESHANDFRRCFLEADTDQSDTVTWQEFQAHLDDSRVQAYFKTLDIDASEVYGLFKLLDLDGNGVVGVNDFVIGCMRLKGQAKAIDLATLMYENNRLAMSIKRLFNLVMDGFKQLGVTTQTNSGEHTMHDQDIEDSR